LTGRRIIIEAVVRKDMRLPYRDDPNALGDWFTNADGDIVIQAVGTDPLGHREAFLVALHELVEMALCEHAGIAQAAVDAHDSAFKGEGEPGDAWNAPYRAQHRRAMLVEHLVADWLGMAGYGTVK